MLDKYKDKNEFYSLVGIKCYSYVPSLVHIVLLQKNIILVMLVVFVISFELKIL
ncbi:hypothetical protein [Spiroplasma endosymbiont of Tipula paludosa]|uniref:hypothetical protein n=1 Tax=Spiroplasma endosymbiont of Tipula paludosa TaxID=3066295 RepID=UPI0035C8BA19